MSDLPLRQRTTTELVDVAFQVYRRDPLQFILGAALIYVPWMILQLAIGIQATVLPTPTQLVITMIGGSLVYAFAGGVTTILASDVYFGRPTDLARAFQSVFTHALPLLLTWVITLVFMMVAAVFLVLPVLYPLARFFCVRQVVLLEDGSAGRALSRSSKLSEGTKRHILNTLLLIGLLVMAVSIGGGAFVGLIPNRIIQLTLRTAITALIFPFWGITETLLYYDLRIRKEGFDVEHLASIVTDGEPTTAASA